MGVDDANEGFGPGECLEHEWGMAEMKFTLRGVDWVHACKHCPAISYQQRAGNDPRRPKR